MFSTKRILLPVIGVILLLVLGIIATENGFEISDANRAPDFTLRNMDGELVSLSDFNGKVVILNFWATWCAPCREEIPGFIELQTKYDRDLVILGISVDMDGPTVVPPYAEKMGINYPVLYATTEIMTDYGGITGIPTSFILDRNLVIQRSYLGYRPSSVFERDVESLL